MAWELDEGNGLPFGPTSGESDGGRREPHPAPLSSLLPQWGGWEDKSGLDPSLLHFLAG